MGRTNRQQTGREQELQEKNVIVPTWGSACKGNRCEPGISGCGLSPEPVPLRKGTGRSLGLDGRIESNYRMKGRGREKTRLAWSKSLEGFKAGAARRGQE